MSHSNKKKNKRRKKEHNLIRNSRLVRLIYLAILVVIFTPGCGVSPEIPLPALTATSTVPSTSTEVQASNTLLDSGTQPAEEQILSTPTPAPTATPSRLDYLVEDIVSGTGIRDLVLFTLSGEDLVNLLISVLIVLLGSMFGVLLINAITWIARLTPPKVDDRLLQIGHRQLKLLITLFLLQFSTARLAFLSPGLKQWLDIVYFSFLVILMASLIWEITEFFLKEPLIEAASPGNRNLVITFAPLLRRLIQVLIIIVGLAVILTQFGVNLSALLAVLGLGGLAVSLAAKATLEDMINGFIILIDRPFQVGDRIKIESMDDWGDVEAIGSRTTQIRALDNRLVIVPNSIIGRNQVENFTLSDPSYRVDISFGVSYEADIDQVIEIVTSAIQGVPGILKGKAPSVDFIQFGDSAMIFRALYWLKTYKDYALRTQVNKAISTALSEANIEMPFVTYDINLAYKNPPVSSLDGQPG